MATTMYMNDMPIAIFSALQNYVLEKAESHKSREAAAMVEQQGTKYRMFLELSIDPSDLGRTYRCETEYSDGSLKKSRFDYYGGAKR